MANLLTTNPISGLQVIVSRDDEAILPTFHSRTLDQITYRAIKKNKTKIIKDKDSSHQIRKWQP